MLFLSTISRREKQLFVILKRGCRIETEEEGAYGGTIEDREIGGCLSACGPGAEHRERYLALARGRQTKAQMRLLWRRRKALMEELHLVQKQVDRIDFLLRSLERADEIKE